MKRKVDHVDCENGWFKLANELAEGLFSSGLSGPEFQIMGMLIRYSYGVRVKDVAQKSCEWSIRIAAQHCKLSKSTAAKAWKYLLEKNMVICYQNPGAKIPGIYGPNKEASKWLLGSTVPDTKTGSSVHQLPDTKGPNLGHSRPKSRTLNGKISDTKTRQSQSNQHIAEAVDKTRQEYMYSTTASHVPPAEEEVKSESRRLFLLFVSLVTQMQMLMPSDTNKQKALRFLDTPIPHGLPVLAWWTAMETALRQAVTAIGDKWRANPKSINRPDSVVLVRWPLELKALLNAQQDPQSDSTPPPKLIDDAFLERRERQIALCKSERDRNLAKAKEKAVKDG